MTVEKISAVTLRADVKASVEFYRTCLGCKCFLAESSHCFLRRIAQARPKENYFVEVPGIRAVKTAQVGRDRDGFHSQIFSRPKHTIGVRALWRLS